MILAFLHIFGGQRGLLSLYWFQWVMDKQKFLCVGPPSHVGLQFLLFYVLYFMVPFLISVGHVSSLTNVIFSGDTNWGMYLHIADTIFVIQLTQKVKGWSEHFKCSICINQNTWVSKLYFSSRMLRKYIGLL